MKNKMISVTARIPAEYYARILQRVDGFKAFKDVSECVRDCVKNSLQSVELDAERIEWLDKYYATVNSSSKSNKKKKGLLSWLGMR